MLSLNSPTLSLKLMWQINRKISPDLTYADVFQMTYRRDIYFLETHSPRNIKTRAITYTSCGRGYDLMPLQSRININTHWQGFSPKPDVFHVSKQISFVNILASSSTHLFFFFLIRNNKSTFVLKNLSEWNKDRNFVSRWMAILLCLSYLTPLFMKDHPEA